MISGERPEAIRRYLSSLSMQTDTTGVQSICILSILWHYMYMHWKFYWNALDIFCGFDSIQPVRTASWGLRRTKRCSIHQCWISQWRRPVWLEYLPWLGSAQERWRHTAIPKHTTHLSASSKVSRKSSSMSFKYVVIPNKHTTHSKYWWISGSFQLVFIAYQNLLPLLYVNVVVCSRQTWFQFGHPQMADTRAAILFIGLKQLRRWWHF